MVSTKSMKAAEKAARAAEETTEASNMGLDGRVEDETELEAIEEVVHEHSDALARLEEGLARVQADAKADADDLRQRLEDLMRAIASLQARGNRVGGARIPAEPAIEGGGAPGAVEAAATAAGGSAVGGTTAATATAAQGGTALATAGAGGAAGGGAIAAKAAATQADASIATAEGSRAANTGPSLSNCSRGGLGSVTDTYDPRDCGPKGKG
ncbi:unnamed protein product [Linum trigynum]|uniref:Uncharacterized protein n=1 Tax=Linum trigynum TaxID=586398 RepID=A0AAV2GJD2_9ROSI